MVIGKVIAKGVWLVNSYPLIRLPCGGLSFCAFAIRNLSFQNLRFAPGKLHGESTSIYFDLDSP